MKEIKMTVPKLAFAVVTRAALALGVGLLVSPKVPADRRRILGVSLIALGVLTTIPLVRSIFGGARDDDEFEPALEDGDRAQETNGRPAPESLRAREVPVF